MFRRLAAIGCLCIASCVNEGNVIEDLVTQYCQTRWEACGCDRPGVTQTSCESMQERLGSDAQSMAQDAGLQFDKDCAKRWLERVEPNCDPALEFENPDCFPGVCALYHGKVAAEEPCTRTGEWSDCAQGLVCGVLDTCQDPCAGHRRGDSCGGDNYTPCVGELVCTADGVCGDPPGTSEPCSRNCERGASCDFEQGLCVASGKAGDACTNAEDCGDGFHCGDEAVCEPDTPEVCSIELPW